MLAKQRFNLRERDLQSLAATFIPFSAHTRMSGVNIGERQVRKGAADAIQKQVEGLGQVISEEHPDHRAMRSRAAAARRSGGRRRPGARRHRA